MCLAIYAPKGKQISHRLIKRAWQSNPHGAGLMYGDGEKLYVYHFPKSERQLWDFYQKLTGGKSQQHNMVFHFRYATHGMRCAENLHPMLVNDRLGVVHNGIIPIKGTANDWRSDTRIFVEDFLTTFDPSFYKDSAVCATIAGLIAGSKLIFLDAEGNHSIVNEHLGMWKDGVWYSNDSGFRRAAWSIWSWEDEDPWENRRDRWAVSDDNYAELCLWCEEPIDWDAFEDWGFEEGDISGELCADCQYYANLKQDWKNLIQEEDVA